MHAHSDTSALHSPGNDLCAFFCFLLFNAFMSLIRKVRKLKRVSRFPGGFKGFQAVSRQLDSHVTSSL